ncbi:MAG: 4Fe-4S binding protein [Candidatus Hydrogenedentota bacterium]|nr:MAG: 4Fe-4S binding protein [Candidatus Hydrogenedentota bacterium]
MGKYLIAIDMEKCKGDSGCALECLRACPTKVLAHRPLEPANPVGGVHIQATHPLLCNGCMACVDACEPGAIIVTTFSR